MANETPSRPPPPLMANAIKNFHFDFLTTSLIEYQHNFFQLLRRTEVRSPVKTGTNLVRSDLAKRSQDDSNLLRPPAGDHDIILRPIKEKKF